MKHTVAKVLRSGLRVIGAVFCGTLSVALVSLLFPPFFSAYGLVGLLINSMAALLVLTFFELRKDRTYGESKSWKQLLLPMMFVPSFAVIALLVWNFIEMKDSHMTSSLNGVVMRVDGELTLDGWINIAEFACSVPLVALVICCFYVAFLNLRRGTDRKSIER